MMMAVVKKWVLTDFDCCPECGNSIKILTSGDEEGIFYEDDEVLCAELCGARGIVRVGDGDGSGDDLAWVNWDDLEI